MVRSAPTFALLLLFGGCVGDAPMEVGASTGAIINGSRITNMPFVVAVVRTGSSGAGGLCSGTMIGDYAVLTAKHCVFDDSSGTYRPVAASGMLVVVGHDLTSPSGITDRANVYEIRTTPGSDVDRDINNGNDIAVLLLATPLSVGARVPSRRAPVGGETVTLAGFGRTRPGTPVDGDSGVKYRGSARVNRVGARIMETTGASWTCQGDSGGPALAESDNRILGVTSFGIGGCTVSNSFFSRVDNHRALIDPTISWMPPCDPSPEICDGVDNDCNGTADEGCTALGQACASDAECSMGRCDDVGGARVCVRDCDPRTAIPACPFGFYCEATGCGAGRCIAADPGALSDGAPCAGDAECGSLSCADVGGTRRCGRQCAASGDACPAGDVCEVFGPGCGSCIPVELSTAPRGFGVSCDEDGQCLSGLCGEGAFCTRPCAAADPCPGGYHCRAGTCVLGDLGGPGVACVSSEDCGAAAPECIDVEGDPICVAPCDDTGACPPGFECAATETGDRCVPPGLPFGSSCMVNPECRSGVCAGFCTRLCASDAECPDGYECREAGDASGCFPRRSPPSSDGGCGVAPGSVGGPAGSAPGALLLGLALLRRRRRR